MRREDKSQADKDGKGQRKASSDILGGVEGVVIKSVHWAKIGKKTGTFGFFSLTFSHKNGRILYSLGKL